MAWPERWGTNRRVSDSAAFRSRLVPEMKEAPNQRGFLSRKGTIKASVSKTPLSAEQPESAGADSDGVDGGDSDGTDGGDSDGTDTGDSDGTDS